MVTSKPGVRRCAAATSITLLLLTGAACSTDVPTPTPTPTVAGPSGPATAAPGPKQTPTETLPPPATTPVPQRSPGDINSTVPSTPTKSKKPVKLDQPADAGGGVTARLTAIKAVTAKAKGPGEVTGPALAVTTVVKNGAKTALDLDEVVVTLDGSDGSPGNPMSNKPAKPITGRLAPGKSVTGVYVFALSKGVRNPVTVQVTLAGGATVLVFTGDAR